MKKDYTIYKYVSEENMQIVTDKKKTQLKIPGYLI